MKSLQDLVVGDVKSAYLGRANKCCCGCVGTHYNPTEPGFGDSDRAMLLNVLRTIQANEESLNDDVPGIFSANVAGKVFMVEVI